MTGSITGSGNSIAPTLIWAGGLGVSSTTGVLGLSSTRGAGGSFYRHTLPAEIPPRAISVPVLKRLYHSLSALRRGSHYRFGHRGRLCFDGCRPAGDDFTEARAPEVTVITPPFASGTGAAAADIIKPRSGLLNRPRFGKIRFNPEADTPNHFASVAEYSSTEIFGTHRPELSESSPVFSTSCGNAPYVFCPIT